MFDKLFNINMLTNVLGVLLLFLLVTFIVGVILLVLVNALALLTPLGKVVYSFIVGFITTTIVLWFRAL